MLLTHLRWIDEKEEDQYSTVDEEKSELRRMLVEKKKGIIKAD